MKKILTFTLIFILIALSFSYVFADSGHYKIELTNETIEANPENEFSVCIDISDIKNVGEGINAVKGVIAYNPDVLEFKSVKMADGWDSPEVSENYTPGEDEESENWNYDSSDKLVAVSVTNGKYLNSDFELMTVTFKVSENATENDTAVVKVAYLDLANDNDYEDETMPTLRTKVTVPTSKDQEENPTPDPTPVPTPDPVINDNFTDFSTAKVELKKDGISNAIVEVSGVSIKEGHVYYTYITNSTTQPTMSDDHFGDGSISMEYDEANKVLKSYDISKYVEKNQDLYLWIVEYDSENTTNKSKVVLSEKKLTRFTEPKYADAFFATHMTKLGTVDAKATINDVNNQIVTAFTHTEENNRKMQIKIGKITDVSILKKIKNQDATGFSDLLKFAKTGASIYDSVVEANKNLKDIEFTAGTTYSESSNKDNMIDLKNIEDDAYYYLYVKTDDENGTYISNEAVTLAMGNDHKEAGWALFFYGSNDFKWNINDGDNTVVPTGVLPQTGEAITIIAIALIAIAGGTILWFKYKKYDY